MNFFGHLHTVNTHRRLVRHYCFKVGLYRQGFTHDLSKYSISEFWVGVKYFQGFKSPNAAERDEKGYSESWMHHKGRNKHHYEYWNDYCKETKNQFQPVEMPRKYLVESICDRLAACKVYKKKEYTDADAYEYFISHDKAEYIHPNTYSELDRILLMLKNEGEKKTLNYLKNVYLKEKK